MYACDYSNFHEHTRVYGQPKDKWDPKYCDKYKSGKRLKKKVPFVSPPKLDHEAAMKLYEEGLNDAEIARRLGCSYTRVQNWRKLNKLKSNARNGHRAVVDTVRAQEMYHEGLSDTAIGKALGCSTETVRRWRIDHGLKANERKAHCTIDWDKALELHKEGLTDTEISAQLHCRSDSVRKWRIKNGLPANISPARLTRIGPHNREKIYQLHARGLLDTEIALVIGCSSDSIYKHRVKRGLPTNSGGGRRRVPLDVEEYIDEGFAFDKPTGLWWVFRHGNLVAVARDQVEAAVLYEQKGR